MVEKDQFGSGIPNPPFEGEATAIRGENRLTGIPADPQREQRREERYPLPVHLELSRITGLSEIPECAILRNMSENGVALEHSLKLRVGEIVSIKLLDIPIDLPCRYSVEILWQKEPTHEDGIYTSGGRIVPEET